MEKFNRAVRRHHVERLKKARQHYWGFYPNRVDYKYPFRKSQEPTPRQLGRLLSAPVPCACWMCNRPRKVFGLSLKEIAFNELCRKVCDDDPEL